MINIDPSSPISCLSVLTSSINFLAGVGKEPYAIGQIVELMPDSLAPVKAKITAIKDKVGRFLLTLELYKEPEDKSKAGM